MKMIADGKIKEGTIINRIDINDEVFKYKYQYGNLYYNDTIELKEVKTKSDNITGFFGIKTLTEATFEILEDKIEEIEELVSNYTMSTYDVMVKDKINELVREINQIKKEKQVDTSKETNCMTD